MKKMMAVFVLLFATTAVFLAAAFSASAEEEQLKDIDGSNGLKISASAVEGTDYDYVGDVLTIKSDKAVTISSSGTTTSDKIVVDSEDGTNITLKDVNIDVSSTNKAAAFEIAEGTIGDVKVTLSGKNTLKSGSGCAGLQKTSDECLLLIQGNAGGLADEEYNLEAAGGTDGAGIGGGTGHAGKNITIESGKVKASNNGGGAGIGGGDGGDGTDIKICGSADVTAVGSTGAGIGGGANKSGKDIEIYGNAKVNAIGGSNSNGAGIGGGGYGDGTGIKIYGNADVIAGDQNGLGAGIGGGYRGKGSDITIDGNVTIKATSRDGAGIGGGSNGDGEGITIKGGTLIEATSNMGGAGIGGGVGGGNGKTIKISGGTVKATAIQVGAGIGGGTSGNGSDIEISGGTVTAICLRGQGAGIGGGMMGDGSDIRISGGKVIAICGSINEDGTITAGSNGAGIGGGNRSSNKGGNGSGIKISGGTVTAIGGSSAAGIGGGNGGKGSDIEISGGTVEATVADGNGNKGAGIGGGFNGDAENIKITGGTVKAFVPGAAPAIGSGGGSGSVDGIYISGNADVIAAAYGGAGIGCGAANTSVAKNIEIFGNAKVRAYSQNQAGIGATGSAKTVDTIKIYEDANVTAIGGNSAAGIGGSPSNNQEVKNISIYGNASVTAIAGYSGAGIGGGAWNNGATTSGISISDNATVIATGSNGGAGIGSGLNDIATDITISDNATVIASSAYNKDLYDPSIYETTLTINGTEITGFADGNIKEWMSHFSTSGTGVGIGSNGTNECVITIEGGTVTAYGNENSGIGNDDAVVTIKGTSSTSCPIVCTNEIKSTTAPDDYPTEYWGIVFEDTHTNFDKGIVYGDGKAVDLSERTKAYVLDEGKVLTVLDNVTFIPGNKFTLDASTLYLKEGATLDKWYEMTKENDGEIKHEHRSDYQWYDVEDYSFINTTNYKKLYNLNDKEGIVLCDICGDPEPHNYDPTGGWEKDDEHHWHLGECDLGADCSVNENPITVCSYIVDGKLDYGTHTYNFDDVPEYKNGEWIFKCTVCEFELSMEIPVISLFKVDGENNPLAGAEFGLYSDAACTTRLTTATSSNNAGKAVAAFESGFGGGNYIKPNTTYYIKETKAPEGYKASDKVFTASIAIVDGAGKVTYGAGSEEPPVCQNIANEPDDPTPDDPTPDDPTPDDPTPDDPAPDDPTPDDPTPDDNKNPNTGVGIGAAGLAGAAVLIDIIYASSAKKGNHRRKKKNSDDGDIGSR